MYKITIGKCISFHYDTLHSQMVRKAVWVSVLKKKKTQIKFLVFAYIVLPRIELQKPFNQCVSPTRENYLVTFFVLDNHVKIIRSMVLKSRHSRQTSSILANTKITSM